MFHWFRINLLYPPLEPLPHLDQTRDHLLQTLRPIGQGNVGTGNKHPDLVLVLLVLDSSSCIVFTCIALAGFVASTAALVTVDTRSSMTARSAGTILRAKSVQGRA